MILQPGFYTVNESVLLPGSVQALLAFNAQDPIFSGHFPGQPVVPGVCMLQIVKEITIMAIGHPLQLQKAAELKFLAIIDPRVHSQVNISIQYSRENEHLIGVTARLFLAETIFFKFKGIFSPA
jgi:3-hydroxyacyl-[acyl-carrier-protein] dehydratase